VRQDPRIKSLPVVLISSLDSDEDRQRATEVGASAYLSKNAYERGALLDLIRSVVPS
jgi:two-component system chemotaxis sensor kinase CheA